MARRGGFLNWKIGLMAIALFVGVIVIGMTAGINDGGFRTVIQYPSGKLIVKFTEGWYLKWFGTATEYPNVITYDFDRDGNPESPTLDKTGISIRYRDGGTGKAYGIAQFQLPTDEATMLELHRTYRSPEGVANKLIKQVVEESMNLTAGLMTSEDAYDPLRAVFTEWATAQVRNGKFRTTTEQTVETDPVTGKSVTKTIPVIAYGEDGMIQHQASDLATYGITLLGNVRLNDPEFEGKTLTQIERKREATMAIITAKADAERAKQEAITAEEKGKANVMTAKYEKEVEKERAVVVAEQNKEVAVIKARQNVEVASQKKLEAEQMKLRAAEIKQEQILLGEGEAERKRLVMEADGQLALKLEAWKETQIAAYKFLGQNKLVPDTMIINGQGGSDMANAGNNFDTFIDVMTMNSLNQLNTDLDMKGQTPATQ